MSLPVNINDLIHGNSVEWERLEFKQGWNPEDIIHSMCAFANDINNWGGGYIIIGIAEKNGQPIFPPAGLQQNQLDAYQKKIFEQGNKISPAYFPIVQPYQLQGEHILVLWCPAGDNRPYDAPEFSSKGSQRFHYIRILSNSIKARGENLRRLYELAARIPFDDRVNNEATLLDFDLGLIQSYLHEVKSSLFEESKRIPFDDLCRTMLIAKGPNEDIRPVNIGLLFFSKEPERFLQRTWIELVWHKNNSGRDFTEAFFKGPIQKHLRDTLSFIKSNIILEKVIKHKDKAESDRFFNYPYEAIEEALSNAVYHKSYELRSPIEVQVFTDKITILSHPGPVPPVNAHVMANQRQIIAREYRNRRIGDFLKELHLTEGRGTGFPTNYDAMAKNGSPEPIFETDETTYVLVTIPIHDSFKNLANDQLSDRESKYAEELTINNLADIIALCNQVTNQVSNQVSNQVNDQVNDQGSVEEKQRIIQILKDKFGEYVIEILILISNRISSSKDILKGIGLTKQTKHKQRYIDSLLNIGWIEYTIPENPKDRNQKYKLTPSGKRVVNLINTK